MAKVLISLLGTGKLINDKESRRYETTDYSINGKIYSSESFVANPIIFHYKIDKLFFIGTNRSMWDEIGNTFGVSEEICTSLLEKQYQDTIVERDLIPINDALDHKFGSKGSKCIVTNEGINDTELWEAFKRFVEILDAVEDHDELYLDITHLFRSLSVMALVMIEFGLSYKRFKLKGIFYGQLNKDPPSPIIDLTVFFEFLEWSKAIYNLKTYGNGHSLNILVKNTNESNEIKNSFSDFADALSITDMGAMQQSIRIIKEQIQLFEESENPIIKIISKQLIQFVKRFDADGSLSKFQFELTKWYAANHNYAMAYITLVEAAISAKCEIDNIDSVDRNKRNKAKRKLFNDDQNIEIKNTFEKVSNIRNNIAHKILDNAANLHSKSYPKDSILNFAKYLSILETIKK
jgi:CRISPR-associated Csx2 family protein